MSGIAENIEDRIWNHLGFKGAQGVGKGENESVYFDLWVS